MKYISKLAIFFLLIGTITLVNTKFAISETKDFLHKIDREEFDREVENWQVFFGNCSKNITETLSDKYPYYFPLHYKSKLVNLFLR